MFFAPNNHESCIIRSRFRELLLHRKNKLHVSFASLLAGIHPTTQNLGRHDLMFFDIRMLNMTRTREGEANRTSAILTLSPMACGKNDGLGMNDLPRSSSHQIRGSGDIQCTRTYGTPGTRCGIRRRSVIPTNVRPLRFRFSTTSKSRYGQEPGFSLPGYPGCRIARRIQQRRIP